MKCLYSMIALGVLMTLTGCLMSQRAPTAQQVEMQQQILSRLMNGSAAATVQNAAQTDNTKISEQELSDEMASFGKPGQPVSFERKSDGFDVNGMRYVDPQGVIVSYGFDVSTGDITYLAETGSKQYAVKFTRALSVQPPVQIATVRKDGAVWTVKTRTGQTLSGQSLTPLSRGFLVARETAGFIYEPGQGITNIGVPDSFHIASFQNGEVLQTGYVLIERNPVDKDNQVKSLFNSVKSFGSAIGVNKKEDYALFNVKNGRAVPINIDASGKDVAIRSECRQVNNFVRDCEKVDYFESLFDKHGQPNGTHYFWRIDWFAGKDGTYLISEEGTRVLVTNIDTGKQVEAFSRLMGINYVSARRTQDSKISLRAKLGFNEEQIDDLETFFSQAPDASKG